MQPRPHHGLVTAAALVIILAGVHQLAPILGPILVAALLSMLCFPIMRRLESLGLPFLLAVAITLIGMCAVGFAIVVLIGGSLDDLLRRLPDLQRQWIQSLRQSTGWLREQGLSLSDEMVESLFNARQVQLASTLLQSTIRSLGSGFIVLIMMFFMLAEALRFPAKMQAALGADHVATLQMREIVLAFRRYIAIKTAMSMATGLSVGLMLWLFNIEFAVLWGFIAFLLNYIPSIGSLAAAIPPTLMVLGSDGWGWAAAVAGWYLAVNTAFGSLLEPRLQGEGLGLSPLVVFLSLFFWGWLLGPVGVLLSAPLTMVVKIAADALDDLRWLAVLLGPPR